MPEPRDSHRPRRSRDRQRRPVRQQEYTIRGFLLWLLRLPLPRREDQRKNSISRVASRPTPASAEISADPIPRAERLVLFLLGLHLSFLPWALGAMHVWSQVVSCVLAAGGFIAALQVPRPGPESADHVSFSRRIFRGLPIGFWFGALALLYVLIQALNPAWRYVQSATSWWLEPVGHISWLPSGVEAPFTKSNPWRSLLIYCSAWLTAAALWRGLRHRHSLRTLLAVVVINAFVLAMLGLAQKALHADKIFWSWSPPVGYFVSSFIYRNHAGAYFNLMLPLCAGLALWSQRRAERRHDKSSPAPLLAFMATGIAMLIFLSESRASSILMAISLLAIAAVAARHLLRGGGTRKRLLVAGIMLAGFGVFLVQGLQRLNTANVIRRFSEIREEYADPATTGRALAAKATFDLIRNDPLTGSGAGTFRHVFPQVQRNYESIHLGGQLYWEHAHNDYLEAFAELGGIGFGLAAAAFFSLAHAAFRNRAWLRPLGGLIAIGLLTTLLHALIDFPFNNPAILITWIALAVAVARLGQSRSIGGGSRPSALPNR